MKRVFVDTNVFLRHFTRDDSQQQKRAVALFRSAAVGETELITGPPVLFEIAWALRRAYARDKADVLNALEAVAGIPGLTLTDAPVVERAITRARETGQEFADAYIAVSADAAGADAVATFNRKDFRKLGAPLYPL